MYVLQQLAPLSVLDIGKGFGKYGFLLHEYAGIDTKARPDPSRTLAEQSRCRVDAVESNPAYMWPHIPQLYINTVVGRIEDCYSGLPRYDVVLMLDVIEHLESASAAAIVRHFIAAGSTVVVSTPSRFFQQDLYESEDERHVSFWGVREMRGLAPFMDYQPLPGGRVFVLSAKPVDIRGFGRSAIKTMRRLAHAVLVEFGAE